MDEPTRFVVSQVLAVVIAAVGLAAFLEVYDILWSWILVRRLRREGTIIKRKHS